MKFNSKKRNNKLEIGIPDHILESIQKSKYYNKMIEEQEQSKNENRKTIRADIAITNKINQISGGNVITGFESKEKIIEEEKSSSNQNKSINNEKDINQINNNNSIDNDKINNNNNLTSHKNESIISSSKKNSVKENIILSNENKLNNIYTNNDENQNSIYKFKSNPYIIDKSEEKVEGNCKKEKKKLNYSSEEELDAKDKLKTLKIEINSKNLEDQIRQILLEKLH